MLTDDCHPSNNCGPLFAFLRNGVLVSELLCRWLKTNNIHMLSRTVLLRASYEDIGSAAQVLGVSVKCSAKELKERYKQLVRTNHPDAGGDLARMTQITTANELLSSLSQAERDQFATRSRFDRSGRHFSSVQYTYTYAAAPTPRVRSVWRNVSSRGKSLILFEPVVDGSTCGGDFARKCTIACSLVAAYILFASLWNVTSWLSLREVYRESDSTVSAKLSVLHEERKLLNADIANLKMTIKNPVNANRRDLSEELAHLLQVRQLLNEEIELCVAPEGGSASTMNNRQERSASTSTGLSVGLIVLLVMLPRFCRVANFTAH